jgi:hypothetical protein
VGLTFVDDAVVKIGAAVVVVPIGYELDEVQIKGRVVRNHRKQRYDVEYLNEHEETNRVELVLLF